MRLQDESRLRPRWLCLQQPLAVMKSRQRRPVPDGYQATPLLTHQRQQPVVEQAFGGLVERAGGLVGKHPLGFF